MTRNLNLDLLKILLAVMVVGIHASILREKSQVISYVFVDYVFRIAVPSFFIMGGYFLYSKIDKISEFIKWEKRVVFLYIFWAIIYLPVTVIDDFSRPAHSHIFELVKDLFFGYHHLWYLPAMAEGAVVLYYLRNLSDLTLIVLCALLYATGMAIEYAASYHLVGGILLAAAKRYETYRNFLFFGFPLVSLGYLMAKRKVPETVKLSTLAIVAAIGVALASVELAINLHFKNYSILDMLGYIPFISVVLVTLAMKYKRVNGSSYLAYISAVIYFIHPILLEHVHIPHIWSSVRRVIFTLIVLAATGPIFIYLNSLIVKKFRLSVL